MPRPEISFKAGAVRAAIFRNQIMRGSQVINIGKVVLEVRYKDKNGEWKSASSMSANEIPKAMLVLQKAYEYLLTHKDGETETGAIGASQDDDKDEASQKPEVVQEKIG